MNLVRTKVGERFYNPLLGSRIEDQMFEIAGSDAAMELEDDIVLLLDNFAPRVANTQLKVVYRLLYYLEVQYLFEKHLIYEIGLP